jgi:hypothetical protein
MTPEHCVRCHHLHQVSRVTYDEALSFGVPPERMSLLELGLDDARFFPLDTRRREQLREQFGVPKAVRVVLCVAAINRRSKRVDQLVEAMKLLDDRHHLVLCGVVEDRSVLSDARRKLAGRLTHLNVAPEQMNDVYGPPTYWSCPLSEGFAWSSSSLLAGVPVLLRRTSLPLADRPELGPVHGHRPHRRAGRSHQSVWRPDRGTPAPGACAAARGCPSFLLAFSQGGLYLDVREGREEPQVDYRTKSVLRPSDGATSQRCRPDLQPN